LSWPRSFFKVCPAWIRHRALDRCSHGSPFDQRQAGQVLLGAG